ncbi:MAG: hypothetical protein RLZZ435_74 [Cyanobacteriota bacterium]
MGRGKKDENKICLTAEQRHRLEECQSEIKASLPGV